MLLLLLALSQPSRIQAADTETQKNFKFSLAPYAWLTSISGRVSAGGYSAKGDEPFTKLTSHINFATMLAAEILAYDRIGFAGNINIASLGDHSSKESIRLNSESTMILGDATLFYRVGSIPLKSGAGHVFLDLLGGVRLWDFDATLEVRTSQSRRKVSQRESWLDPIVGVRAWVHFTDAWSLELRGGVGGFGVNSDLTWDASALVSYSLWKNNKLLAGYRAVGVDYAEGHGKNKFMIDGKMHGPMIGLLLKF